MIPNYNYSHSLDPTLMSDIVLTGDDTAVRGHLAVLASQSPFLKDLFLSTPIYEEETVLIVPGAKAEDLDLLVSFLYGRTPEVKLPAEIFLRLDLVGGKKSEPPPPVLFNDYNSNMMDNPDMDIDTAEVLIDNQELLNSSDSLAPLFCIFCNNGFSSKAGLRDHLRHHPICVLCNNQFVRNSDLLEHWQTHPQCGLCGERVLDQAALEDHELGHVNIEDSLNNIPVINLLGHDPLFGCNQLLQEMNPDIQIHDVQLGPKELEEFGIVLKCDHCAESFNSMLDLEYHIIEEHETQAGESFPPLGVTDSDLKDTDSKRNPQLHQESGGDLQSQVPVKEEEVVQGVLSVCVLCKVSFTRTRDLSHHVLRNHPVDRLDSGRVFPCQVCTELGYLNLSDLETHVSLEHKEAAPSYQCPDCTKDFKTSRFLRNHIRTHISEKAFQCGRCMAVLSTESGLRSHVKKCVKAKTKRFTCVGCDQKFKDRVTAEIHVVECRNLQAVKTKKESPSYQVEVGNKEVAGAVVISSDEEIKVPKAKDRPRNFHCVDCDKTFLTLSHLKEHSIQHTKVYPFNCNICARGFRRRNIFENHICNRPVKEEEFDEPKKEIKNDDDTNIQAGKVEVEVFEDQKKMDGSGDIDMNVIINGTSRSGRVLKPKRFFEDLVAPEKKKRKKSSDLTPAASSSRCVRTSLQCTKCGVEFPGHSSLFRHFLMSHVPEEIVRTLPVYNEGETGWCQNCQEPLPVTHAELHMAEKHPELCPLSGLQGPPPSPSPAPSNSGEENHKQAADGDLTEKSEQFLEKVKTALEEEEELCAKKEKKPDGPDSADVAQQEGIARISQYNLKDLCVVVEKSSLTKMKLLAGEI